MIEVLKQALEALDEITDDVDGTGLNTNMSFDKSLEAITSLRQAIAELESQEPVAWTSDDMAYRPSGLPQDFVKHEVESVYDWSDWVCPNPEQYFMKCCDCGLVHEMQFKVAKYKLGNECEFVEDTNLQAVFKARRTHQPERTWVGLTDEEIWQIATDSTIGGDLHADKFAKAIESKLKERNG